MDVIIRKFNHMHSVPEASRRAASGIGQMLTQTPGFRDDSVFDPDADPRSRDPPGRQPAAL
jgi:hypothetical protein